MPAWRAAAAHFGRSKLAGLQWVAGFGWFPHAFLANFNLGRLRTVGFPMRFWAKCCLGNSPDQQQWPQTEPHNESNTENPLFEDHLNP